MSTSTKWPPASSTPMRAIRPPSTSTPASAR
jgi:hypothetical protein